MQATMSKNEKEREEAAAALDPAMRPESWVPSFPLHERIKKTTLRRSVAGTCEQADLKRRPLKSLRKANAQINHRCDDATVVAIADRLRRRACLGMAGRLRRPLIVPAPSAVWFAGFTFAIGRPYAQQPLSLAAMHGGLIRMGLRRLPPGFG
jgi:hypothetical protein